MIKCHTVAFVTSGASQTFVSKLTMSIYSLVLLVFTVLISNLLDHNCVAHPQCLDYGAPFEVSRKSDIFCRSYAKFGCCTPKRDAEIKELFRQLPKQGNEKCSKLLKRVLCLECHPYAAHIFQTEGSDGFDAKTAPPGLCGNFCRSFFKECSRAVKQLLRQDIWKLRPSLRSWNSTANVTTDALPDRLTKSSVCSRLQLNDRDYCYPNVANIDEKTLAKRYNYQTNKDCLCVEQVASGLRNPLAAVHSGDDTNRLFIAEQLGVVRVLELSSGRLLREPFLDFRKLVLSTRRTGDERGLLSIAFHPKYSTNGRFFVYYSSKLKKTKGQKEERASSFWGSEHKTVLSEFEVSASNANAVNPRSEKVILEISQPADNHNGGNILFGDDGYLYLTLGDGGRAGDPFGDIGNGLNRLAKRLASARAHTRTHARALTRTRTHARTHTHACTHTLLVSQRSDNFIFVNLLLKYDSCTMLPDDFLFLLYQFNVINSK